MAGASRTRPHKRRQIELIAAADNVKTDDHDSPWSDIGYQERRERDHEDDCPF